MNVTKTGWRKLHSISVLSMDCYNFHPCKNSRTFFNLRDISWSLDDLVWHICRVVAFFFRSIYLFYLSVVSLYPCILVCLTNRSQKEDDFSGKLHYFTIVRHFLRKCEWSVFCHNYTLCHTGDSLHCCGDTSNHRIPISGFQTWRVERRAASSTRSYLFYTK